MTIKELEIIASSDDLLDMLIYARCQFDNIGTGMNIAQFKYDRNKLFHTLKEIKTEVDKIAPDYEAKCIYRRE